MEKRNKRRARGEGCVFRTKTGMWRAAVWVGGKRQWLSAKSQKELLPKVRDAIKRNEEGLPVEAKNRTLAMVVEDWFEAQGSKGKWKAKTQHFYRGLIDDHLKPSALWSMKLVTLTATLVDKFLREQAEHGRVKPETKPEGWTPELSPKTVNEIRGVLRAAINRAIKLGELTRNNVVKQTQAREQTAEPIKPFTPEEAEKLLGALHGHRLQAILTTMLTLGVRKGEALGLRWSDVNFEAHTVAINQNLVTIPGKGPIFDTPKTAKSRRTIPLPDSLWTLLKTHKQSQLEARLQAGNTWEDYGLVFPTATGRPQSPRNLTRDFHALLAKLGLPRRGIHSLRHSAATLWLDGGANMKTVQTLLGHSTYKLTADTYSHTVEHQERAAVESMDRLLQNAKVAS